MARSLGTAADKLARWLVWGRITRMPTALKSMITDLVSGIEPTDDLGQEHRRNALSWLAGTDDIFRRVKPAHPVAASGLVLPARRPAGRERAAL